MASPVESPDRYRRPKISSPESSDSVIAEAKRPKTSSPERSGSVIAEAKSSNTSSPERSDEFIANFPEELLAKAYLTREDLRLPGDQRLAKYFDAIELRDLNNKDKDPDGYVEQSFGNDEEKLKPGEPLPPGYGWCSYTSTDPDDKDHIARFNCFICEEVTDHWSYNCPFYTRDVYNVPDPDYRGSDDDN